VIYVPRNIINQAQLKFTAIKNGKILPTAQDESENVIEKPLDEEKPKVTNLSQKMSVLDLNNESTTHNAIDEEKSEEQKEDKDQSETVSAETDSPPMTPE